MAKSHKAKLPIAPEEVKVTSTVKYPGTNRTTTFYSDGTECNIYGGPFHPVIGHRSDKPIPQPISDIKSDEQIRLEKRYKHTMSTDTTSIVPDTTEADFIDPIVEAPKPAKKAKKAKAVDIALPDDGVPVELTAPKKVTKKAKVDEGDAITTAEAPAPAKVRKSDADALEVIEGFKDKPLPSLFKEEDVYERLGRWNATLYRWLRDNCVKHDSRIAGKQAWTLKTDLTAPTN